MTIAASAPISAARFVWRIVWSVPLVPVPAMNARSRGIASRAATSTRSRSASESIGNSPVDPSTTYPLSAVALYFRRLAASWSVATSSPRKGVVTGMNTPSKLGIGASRLRALAESRLGRREAGDGDHEGRAGHIGHPDAVAELDRGRLPAVLTADADLEVRTRAPPALDTDLDELAHAFLVEDGEGIVGQHALLEIVGQELRDVVAAVAEGHLREVVGAEREELRVLGDLVGDERRPRHLDHGADRVADRHAHLDEHGVGDLLRVLVGEPHLVDGAGERDHDLGLHSQALLGDRAGSLQDAAHLHGVDLR